MDLTAVAVAADLVSLARGEVEGPGNLLVEENVPDGVKDVRIETERKLADETGAGIGIKNGIQLGRIPAGRAANDPALLEFEGDILEGGAVVDGGNIEANLAFDAAFDRRGENFPVGNIAVTAANDRTDILDTEPQVRVGPFDLHLVGRVHQRLEHFHAFAQFSVVQRADPEVVVLESLRAHLRLLRHGG